MNLQYKVGNSYSSFYFLDWTMEGKGIKVAGDRGKCYNFLVNIL